MKTLKIDHIGIAVENIEKALRFYADTLGLKLEGEEVIKRVKGKNGLPSHGRYGD